MTSRAYALLVLAITLAVFAPAARFAFINEWDDGGLFTMNPWLGWSDLRWTYLTAIYGHWVPLAWLMQIGEFRLWGLDPGPWHAVGVVLHAINAALLYALARRLALSSAGALVAALVWSLHPLRVEPVAWVTEQRMLLGLLVMLLAALAWFAERRVLALVLYAAAVCAHPLAVLLPFALGIWTWYQRRVDPSPYSAWYASVGLQPYPYAPLAPMVIVGTAFAPIIIIAHWNVDNYLTLAQAPWSSRLWQTAYSLAFYLGNSLAPLRLSHLIEYTWVPSASQLEYPIALVACVALTALVLLTWRRWPAFAAALAAYVVFVWPQAGMQPNGPQLVANRYTYFALMPLALLAGGAFTMASRRLPRISFASASAIVAALAAVTLVHLPTWKNSEALWTYAAAHEPTCTYCQDLAAVHAYRLGDRAQAVRLIERAIVVSDSTPGPRWERHWNRAAILIEMGRREEAARSLRAFMAAVPPDRWWVQPERSRLAGAALALAQLEALP